MFEKKEFEIDPTSEAFQMSSATAARQDSDEENPSARNNLLSMAFEPVNETESEIEGRPSDQTSDEEEYFHPVNAKLKRKAQVHNDRKLKKEKKMAFMQLKQNDPAISVLANESEAASLLKKKKKEESLLRKSFAERLSRENRKEGQSRQPERPGQFIAGVREMEFQPKAKSKKAKNDRKHSKKRFAKSK